MRAITVSQPWAWAILHGGKDVENRTRNIAGTYRGPVAIHVSKSKVRVPINSIQGQSPIDKAVDCWWNSPEAKVWLEDEDHWDSMMPWWLDRGAIIGVADLVGVHRSEDCSPWCSAWAMEGHLHLILANPRALVTPVPAVGKLGLWRMDEALIREVGKELPGWEVQALTEAPGADGVVLGSLGT